MDLGSSSFECKPFSNHQQDKLMMRERPYTASNRDELGYTSLLSAVYVLQPIIFVNLSYLQLIFRQNYCNIGGYSCFGMH